MVRVCVCDCVWGGMKEAGLSGTLRKLVTMGVAHWPPYWPITMVRRV